jgi:thioesterase domain-containing protein
MLVPIQSSGSRPPLFFVHGLQGTMPLGTSFSRVLGPDQPLYAVHADGIDGRRPFLHDVGQMVEAYIRDIEEVRPTGPIRIGGMCEGCQVAIEMGRKLQQDGRQTGPLILIDPPPVPLGSIKRNAPSDERRPQAEKQLYVQVRQLLLTGACRPDFDTPFDSRDAAQLHAATGAGICSTVAISKHVPGPYSGPVKLIISEERAPGFFHPQMPWHKLLTGRRSTHVLPGGHMEMFNTGRGAVARLLAFILESDDQDESDYLRRNAIQADP